MATAARPQAMLEGYRGPYYTDTTARLAVALAAQPWHDGYGPNMDQFVQQMSAYFAALTRLTSDNYRWARLYCFRAGGLEAVLAIPRATGRTPAAGYKFGREPCLYLGAHTSVTAANLMVVRLLRLMSESD